MTNSKSLRTLAALTVLFWALGGSALVAQQWAGKGRINGKVVDEEGEPLVGATVTLRKGGEEGEGPDPLTTDEKGRWSYLGLAQGQWMVTFEHLGFYPAEGPVKIDEFKAGESVKVVLRKIPEEVLRQARAESAYGRIDEGNQLLTAGDYAGARAAYEEAMPELEEGQQAEILRGIARTWYEEGDSEKAIETLERALAASPADVDSLRLIVSLLVAADREAEAQVYMDRMPEGEGVDPNALLNVGIKAYNENDLETALESFDKAVAQNPDLADAYYYRGLSYLNLGKNQEAIADLRHLLELAPDHARAEEAQQFLEFLESQE